MSPLAGFFKIGMTGSLVDTRGKHILIFFICQQKYKKAQKCLL
jgi:hypothetical protein